MCNTEQGMMGESSGQSVHCRTLGVVCRSQKNRSAILSLGAWDSDCQFVYRETSGAFCRTRNNRSAILSLPTWERVIEKVAKYGMGKQSVGLVI
jgi:hypothetical protein